MSMGRMSWEGPENHQETEEYFGEPGTQADWDTWWQAVLQSDFATYRQIQEEVGPEYLMYYDMQELEPFFQVYP